MQNKYSTLPFLILLLLPAISLAQSGCELHISPDFASDCVLTSYHNEDDTLHSEDLGDCLLACNGNRKPDKSLSQW